MLISKGDGLCVDSKTSFVSFLISLLLFLFFVMHGCPLDGEEGYNMPGNALPPESEWDDLKKIE